MKVLFVSGEGSTLFMALKMQESGHQVKFYIRLNSNRDVGNGLVDRIDTFSAYTSWADLIIFDDTGFGEKANELRRAGKRVVGGTKYTDRLEMERSFGQTQFEHYGIKILNQNDFSSVQDAIRFVAEKPSRYVVKLDGKLQEEKSLSYVGKENDASDMICMLKHYEEKWGSKIETLQIQECVQGIEVAVSGFFNGKAFLDPIQVNFEHKKLMNGNIGPNTGEMGTAMLWTDKCKLYRKTIEKMAPKLALERYVGNFDINCIVDEEGSIWPLEATCRFGYPDITLKLETMDFDWAEFFYSLAGGEIDTIKTKSLCSVGIVVATPPFPYSAKETFDKYTKGLPLQIKDFEGIYLMDVKDKGGDLIIAGDSGYPAVVCGSGDYMEMAIEEAYSRIENIYVPNMIYRTDIGKEVDENLKSLVNMGILDRFPYCKEDDADFPILSEVQPEEETEDEDDEE